MISLKSALHHPIEAAAQTVSNMPAPEKQVSNTVAIAGILSGFLDVVPTLLSILGGLMGIGWYALQIYNHPAVKEWRARRKASKEN